MDLKDVKKNWEELGEIDPLWAVLSDNSKIGGGWELDDFFETGRMEIKNVLDEIAEFCTINTKGIALDFGCGVGRLTQALCEHFSQSYGVDISKTMIQLANEYNKYGDKCKYILNDRNDLSLFEDNSIDFIYSVIVLQHMEPQYSSNYVKEFVRILKPNGVLRFQIPGKVKEKVELSGAYKAQIKAELKTIEKERALIKVTIKNKSEITWTEGLFNIGNHWKDMKQNMIMLDDQRICIDKKVAPNEECEFLMELDTQVVPKGQYIVEFDLVQEGITWFEAKGEKTASIEMDTSSLKNAPSVAKNQSFIVKFFKSRNFGMSRRVRNSVTVENLSKKMEMHGIEKEELIAMLEELGVQVLEVKEDGKAGLQWESYTYTVKKV